MLFGPKKYIYVSVCFQNSSRPYAYRTEDKSIKINDVVMVPVPGEEAKPAIVTKVQTCTEKDAPYPPDKTKMIIGRADRKTRKLFDGVDMRMPMDISIKSVQTTNGHAVVVTDREERRRLKEQLVKRKDIKLIETQPVSKAYSIVSRDDAGKPVRRGYWKVQEHINGDVTWQCSRCKSVFQHREAFCPKCHSENRKTSHDPVWVDEMEGFDAIFDDR